MSRISRMHVIGVAALLAIGFALALGYAPGVLPVGLRRTFETASRGIDVEIALLFAGVIVAILGLFSSWVWRTDDRSGDWSDVDAESARREVSVAGSELTAAVEEWQAEEEPLSASVSEPLKDPLRDILVAAETRDGTVQEVDVRDALEEGEWTDDRLAGAFLSSSDAVDYPLTHRLYAWLYPEAAYQRRAKRALRAVEDVCAERYSGYEPPEREPLHLDRVVSFLRDPSGGDAE